MKKTLILISSIIVASSAYAEGLSIRPLGWAPQNRDLSAQSVSTKITDRSLNVIWLRDGLDNNYTSLAYPLFQVTGLGNRFEIVSLGAFDSNFSKTNVWLGTGLSANLINSGGWNVKVYGGFKGFNLGDNFRQAEGKEAFVWGLGVSIPIKY
jgi:hypothetical protein